MGKGIDENTYVEDAEKVIKELKNADRRGQLLSTSKIRNILSMLSGIYNRVVHSSEQNILERDVQMDLKYCKVRCAYEAGRDNKVKSFIEKSHMMDYLDWIGNSRDRFILYYRYIEALVAYHRYYGGE